jgi:hypothetical protein
MSTLSEIAKLEKISRDALAQVDGLRAACRHQWAPSIPDNLDAAVPLCSLCGQCGYGWWCEGSPDKTCDYNHSDPEAGRFRIFNPHRCKYCGEPEERK